MMQTQIITDTNEKKMQLRKHGLPLGNVESNAC